MNPLLLIIANIKEISHGYLSNQEEEEDNDDQDDENPENKQYNLLKNEKNEKEKKIRDLENQYREKIEELLIMIQIHCEIKTDMHKKMEEAGVLNAI